MDLKTLLNVPVKFLTECSQCFQVWVRKHDPCIFYPTSQTSSLSVFVSYFFIVNHVYIGGGIRMDHLCEVTCLRDICLSVFLSVCLSVCHFLTFPLWNHAYVGGGIPDALHSSLNGSPIWIIMPLGWCVVICGKTKRGERINTTKEHSSGKRCWSQIMNSSINKVELLHDFSKITI